MTARLLFPAADRVAREDETTVHKLLRAGRRGPCSRMPSRAPHGRAVLRRRCSISSRRDRERHPDLQMEEQLVHPGSPLDGKTVGTSGLRSRLG